MSNPKTVCIPSYTGGPGRTAILKLVGSTMGCKVVDLSQASEEIQPTKAEPVPHAELGEFDLIILDGPATAPSD